MFKLDEFDALLSVFSRPHHLKPWIRVYDMFQVLSNRKGIFNN